MSQQVLFENLKPSSFPGTLFTSSVSNSSKSDSLISSWSFWLTLFLAFVVYDQVSYQTKKGSIAGPKVKIPFLGSFLDSMNPTFAKYLEKWESGALSCVSVFHMFVVISSTRDLSRKLLNASSYLEPCVVDAGKKILGKNNWVFLDGFAHSEFRKGLNGLFSRKALGIYINRLFPIYKKHFDVWIDTSKEKSFHEFMIPIRDLNVAASCSVFCGNYISDEEVKEITECYWRITAAMELVNFPIVLPFTKVWYGIKARKIVLNAFINAAQQSRRNMEAGLESTCMMDEWIIEMIKTRQYNENKETEKPPVLIRMFSDEEIASTFLSFLFASQDATSSSCIWLYQYVADLPGCVERIREEQIRVRDGDLEKPVTLDMVDKMEYTSWVVKEALRIRPPVLMVPYKAKKPYEVNGYTIPKGSMVLPTFWHSLHDPEVYPEPDKFKPERWAPDGLADKNVKNWLVFGVGAHRCLGQQYAMMHMIMLIGYSSLYMDWDHKRTSLSDEQMIFATTFPQDKSLVRFRKRLSC